MTTQHFLNRSYGFHSNNVIKRATASRLVYALQPTSVTLSQNPALLDPQNERPPAHISGVNALTIERFEGRYLLSGGVDSSIAIWDLESPTSFYNGVPSYRPLSLAMKTSDEHKLGITQLCFYPFDSLAFLTSSYDCTVKVYNSETLAPFASFHLDSVVYNIALSPIASHLLVACATQHPAVRLVDLRSGASTHSLVGHSGAILSTAWSPTREHIFASGSTDGTVRFWDIRRSVGELGHLDYEDTIGITQRASTPFNQNVSQGKAHRGAVNGILWTADGHHIITCGHDEHIRVWDTNTRANTLANFGPMVKNSNLAATIPVLAPDLNKDVMFYPNQHEILAFELFEGKLIRRLRRSEKFVSLNGGGQGERNAKGRITALAWRAHDVELYSAHADGSITAWKPKTEEDAESDEDEQAEKERGGGSGKRKRSVLEDIYQGLTKKPMTFS